MGKINNIRVKAINKLLPVILNIFIKRDNSTKTYTFLKRQKGNEKSLNVSLTTK